MNTANERPSRTSFYLGIGMLAFLLLLLLYPLSFAPACILVDHCCSTKDHWLFRFVGTFYAPLGWLVESNMTVREVYFWYAELWGLEPVR